MKCVVKETEYGKAVEVINFTVEVILTVVR